MPPVVLERRPQGQPEASQEVTLEEVVFLALKEGRLHT
jgi:hypothetical protein